MNLKLVPILKKVFLDKIASEHVKGGLIVNTKSESVESIYFVVEGYIKAYSIDGNGEQKIYLFLASGDIFSSQWIFDQEKKPIYYEALGRTHVKKVKKAEFLQMLKSNDEAMTYFMDQAKSVTQALFGRINQLSISKADLRLLAAIVDLAMRFNKQNRQEMIYLPEEITLTDLAASVNMTRETASREIGKLKREGLLEMGKGIVINNLPNCLDKLSRV